MHMWPDEMYSSSLLAGVYEPQDVTSVIPEAAAAWVITQAGTFTDNE